MRAFAALGLLLLAACSSPASSAPGPSTPVASALSCSLPIYWYEGDVPTVVHTGFFHYPQGDIQGESPMAVRSANDTFVAPGATYDRVVQRWLPVTPNAISPDGLRFAYAEYDLVQLTSAGGKTAAMAGALATTRRVHIVDARTGADRIAFHRSPP